MCKYTVMCTCVCTCLYKVYSGAPLIQTPLGPSDSGQIIKVSSFRVIDIMLVWLITKIDDVM